MKSRKLGQTDIEVSVVCQGCWSIVTQDHTWGGNELGDSIAAIQASLDAGVNFFDTAEGYGGGESEEILARALEGRRDEVVIASKVSANRLQPEKLRESCESALRRLRTDYIDLYQIHWPSADVPITESCGAMQELQDAGKVRAFGVSNFGVGYMDDLLPVARPESNQLGYSLLWRPIEFEVLPQCLANDVSVLCYSPIAQGLLTGKFASADDVPASRARTRLFSKDRPESRHADEGCEAEAFAAITEIRAICESIDRPMGAVALAWLIAQPGVASVIAGGRTAAQAAQNAAAGDLELDDDTLAKLAAATEAVKQHIGRNCDMWQSESRMEK